jgi:hypothetical protein
MPPSAAIWQAASLDALADIRQNYQIMQDTRQGVRPMPGIGLQTQLR